MRLVGVHLLDGLEARRRVSVLRDLKHGLRVGVLSLSVVDVHHLRLHTRSQGERPLLLAICQLLLPLSVESGDAGVGEVAGLGLKPGPVVNCGRLLLTSVVFRQAKCGLVYDVAAHIPIPGTVDSGIPLLSEEGKVLHEPLSCGGYLDLVVRFTDLAALETQVDVQMPSVWCVLSKLSLSVRTDTWQSLGIGDGGTRLGPVSNRGLVHLFLRMRVLDGLAATQLRQLCFLVEQFILKLLKSMLDILFELLVHLRLDLTEESLGLWRKDARLVVFGHDQLGVSKDRADLRLLDAILRLVHHLEVFQSHGESGWESLHISWSDGRFGAFRLLGLVRLDQRVLEGHVSQVL